MFGIISGTEIRPYLEVGEREADAAERRQEIKQESARLRDVSR